MKNIDTLAAPQSTVPAARLIKTVSVCERVLIPEEQSEAVLNGGRKHLRIAKARKVDVTREVLGKLTNPDMRTAP